MAAFALIDPLVYQLAQARRRRGMTSMQVASLIGVAVATVDGIESGEIDPSMSVLRRYALAVRVSLGFTVTTAAPPQKEVDAAVASILSTYEAQGGPA